MKIHWLDLLLFVLFCVVLALGIVFLLVVMAIDNILLVLTRPALSARNKPRWYGI